MQQSVQFSFAGKAKNERTFRGTVVIGPPCIISTKKFAVNEEMLILKGDRLSHFSNFLSITIYNEIGCSV